jgi:hypothetical protein
MKLINIIKEIATWTYNIEAKTENEKKALKYIRINLIYKIENVVKGLKSREEPKSSAMDVIERIYSIFNDEDSEFANQSEGIRFAFDKIIEELVPQIYEKV